MLSSFGIAGYKDIKTKKTTPSEDKHPISFG